MRHLFQAVLRELYLTEMINMDLLNLKKRIQSLAIFRGLLTDRVIFSLLYYLENPKVHSYSEFVSCLYESGASSIGEYIKDICENNENIYVKLVGSEKPVPSYMKKCIGEELKTLQMCANLTSKSLKALLEPYDFLPDFDTSEVDIIGSYTHRVKNISKYGYGIYAKNRMFFIDEDNSIVPVTNPDKTTFAQLVDYEAERQVIIDNTKALLLGKPAANIL